METRDQRKDGEVLVAGRDARALVRLFATGVAMGAADVVPGVSGGTMAFILGVYEELIHTIKSFNLEFVRLLFSFRIRDALNHIHWKFLLALGGGIGVAILSLARALSWLLEHEREPLFAFFFGLILASIIAVSAHVHWKPTAWCTLVAGSLAAYVIAGLAPASPLLSPTPIQLFFGGGVAISAMLLPGVSGALILLTLGLYDYLIGAVKSFDLLAALPAMLGMAAGIMLFSRLLSWLLRHYHQVTVTLLIGFMIGSLRVIWPFKEEVPAVDPVIEEIMLRNVWPASADTSWGWALLLCFAGFLLVTGLDQMQSRANPIVNLIRIKKWRMS